jgi:hypothetical protein
MLNFINGKFTGIPNGFKGSQNQRSMGNILGQPAQSNPRNMANIGGSNLLSGMANARPPAQSLAGSSVSPAQNNAMGFEQSNNATREPNVNFQNVMSRLPERAMAGQRGLVGNAMSNMQAPQLAIGSNNQQGRYPTLNSYLAKFR